MDARLKARIQTIAEMKLLELDIGEYLDEVLLDYGFRKTRMAVAEAGLSELLTEDLEKAGQKI